MSADNFTVVAQMPDRNGGIEFRVSNQRDSQYYSGCFLVIFSQKQERAWRKREYRKLRKCLEKHVSQWDLDRIRFGSRPLIARTRDQRCVWQWVFWKNSAVYHSHEEAQAAAVKMEEEMESEYGIANEEWGTPLPTREEAVAAAKRAGPISEEFLQYPG